ncbi:MAG: hypothetical protein K2X99_12005 [Gemmatimonadaceae bacterium]|nr:hypothetical protein [Gemmatimonadaceae bacterium]
MPRTPPPAANVPVARDAAADSMRGPWVLPSAVARTVYRLTQAGVLELESDTLRSRDTLQVTIQAALARTGARISGSLLAYDASLGGAAAATGVMLPLAVAFRVDSLHRVTTTAPASGAPCATPAAALAQPLRELVVAHPDTLRSGARWSDSALVMLCRDGIPLTVTIVRQYQLEEARREAGLLVLRVRRRTRGSLVGEGAQFNEPVSLRGEIEGDATLRISAASGALLSLEGESQLTMQLQGRLRTQRVRQRVALHAAVLP